MNRCDHVRQMQVVMAVGGGHPNYRFTHNDFMGSLLVKKIYLLAGWRHFYCEGGIPSTRHHLGRIPPWFGSVQKRRSGKWATRSLTRSLRSACPLTLTRSLAR